MKISAKRVVGAGPLLAISLLMVVSPTWAQTFERRNVIGTVVDASTGAPIGGAWVGLADGGAGSWTKADGRFVLHDVRIGTIALEASQLGYSDFAEERVIDAGEGELRIALDPDPVMLEGVRVVADRLAARRNAIPYSVRAYDTDRILQSAAADAYDFVRFNTFTRSCGFGTCIYRRGQLVRPVLYIDESPYYGGIDDLHGLPIEHLYMVEIIGSQVRVYTKNFAKRLATRSAPLIPVLFSTGF